MNRKNNKRVLVCVLAAGAGVHQQASAIDINAAVRAIGSYQLDGPADLGLLGGKSEDNFFLDVAPRVLIQIDNSWTGYLRGRAFLPTGSVVDTADTQINQQRKVKSFVKLDEAWLQYNGLTNYPGESVRFGHQLMRQNDTTWISQDADAAQWVVDTTLLKANAGIVHQFSSYRSDGIPLPASQRDRLYGFATFSRDWSTEHSIGVRALHASDLKNLPGVGSTVSESPKLEDSNLTWVGLFAENRYFERRRSKPVAYWADVTYLSGNTNVATRGSGGLINNIRPQNISAVASTVGVRVRPFEFPVAFGSAYAYSGGGGKSQYQQSGLQGNVTNFTGTPTSIYLYNSALGAELGNLRVATAYASYRTELYDASLIYQNFQKDDARVAITANRVVAATNGTSRDVGNGVDFVLSRYFRTLNTSGKLTDGADVVRQEPMSTVRLRASIFDPGKAYGPGADLNYRVTLETILWWF